MTLISTIITDAFREANILPLGKEPTPNQTTEALRLYTQGIISIYGGEAGERLQDWPLGTYDQNPEEAAEHVHYTDRQLHNPPINMRLLVTNPTAATVWLTPRPQDGSRMGVADPFSRLSGVPLVIDGNGRPIEGAPSITLNVDGTFREWFYRADLAAWVKLTGLLADDQNPFPEAYDIMFGILLAMRLNPRYGRTIDDQTVAMLKQNRREFVARYLQSRPLEIDDSISWPFMSTQSYDTQRAFSSQSAFNRGDYRK